MSTQLFNRKYDLQISTTSSNINLSQLHAVFNTTAWVSGTPKTLHIRVYNVNPQTMLQVQNEGGQVVLQAGYEGQYGIIFSGQIIQIRFGRENAVDSFFDITATDGDMFYTQGFISTTVSPELTGFNNRIFSIAGNTSTPINVTSDDIIVDTSTSLNNKLPRGRVYYGMSKDHLRQVSKSMGAYYSIENNNLSIVGVDRTKQINAPVINDKTGLIGYPTQTIEGINIKMLMNPFIVQGMKIQLNSTAIQLQAAQVLTGGNTTANPVTIQQQSQDGFYKVLYVNHTGDTRGHGGLDWITEVVCYTKIVNQNQTQYGLDFRPEQP